LGFSAGVQFYPVAVKIETLNENEKFIDISAGGLLIQAITNQGNLYKWSRSTPQNSNTPLLFDRKLINDKKIIKIASSIGMGSYFLDEDGRLFRGGSFSNNYTEIVTDSPTLTYLDIAVQDKHGVAISKDSTLFAWGDNSSGQLGDGTYNNSETPVRVFSDGVIKNKKFVAVATGRKHTIALDKDGKVYQWGGIYFSNVGNVYDTNSNKPVILDDTGTPMEGNKIIKIDAGYYCSIAMDEDSVLYSWGSNQSGALGNIQSSNTNKPILVNYLSLLDENEKIESFSAGLYHSLVITTKGKIIGWGSSGYGALGKANLEWDSYYNPIILETQNSSLENQSTIFVKAGEDLSFAIDSEGKIHSWGKNQDGALGIGMDNESYTPSQVDYFLYQNIGKVKAVGGNSKGTYLLTGKNVIYFWGMDDNDMDSKFYSLQPKVFNDIGNPLNGIEIDTLVVGWTHAAVLTNDGDIFSWGTNSMGAFGTGNWNPDKSFVPIKLDLPNTDLSGKKIIKITASERGMMALTDEGEVFVWGENWDKYIGTESDDKHIYRPTRIKTTGTDIDGEKITDIAAGRFHYLALSESNKLFSWGNNNAGALGDGTKESKRFASLINLDGTDLKGKTVKEISAGQNYSSVITDEGKIAIWGGHNLSLVPKVFELGTLGEISSGLSINRTAVKLASTWNYIVAMSEKGEIFQFDGIAGIRAWNDMKLDLINIGGPAIKDLSDISINEDNEYKVYVEVSDPDEDKIMLEATTSEEKIGLNIDNDTLVIKPAQDWFGASIITIYATDGRAKDSTSFKLTVNPVQDAPTAFDWVSSALDTVNITQSNLADTYTLQWDASTDVDGDSINYLVYAKIGVYPAEEAFDTTSTSVPITYQELLEGVFEGRPVNGATVRFNVKATDGVDTVDVTGDNRVIYVNRYDYLSTESEGVPVEFALHENYPNPFNPTTTLRFDLPEVSSITLTIYNMLGQKVRTFNYQNTSAGYHSVKWNATNDYGDPVGAGVYLYQLQTKDFVKTRKMVLLK